MWHSCWLLTFSCILFIRYKVRQRASVFCWPEEVFRVAISKRIRCNWLLMHSLKRSWDIKTSWKPFVLICDFNLSWAEIQCSNRCIEICSGPDCMSRPPETRVTVPSYRRVEGSCVIRSLWTLTIIRSSPVDSKAPSSMIWEWLWRLWIRRTSRKRRSSISMSVFSRDQIYQKSSTWCRYTHHSNATLFRCRQHVFVQSYQQ